MVDRISFRIRKSGRGWRVEDWMTEPPYGPAWQPLITGFTSEAEARGCFARLYATQDIEWDMSLALYGTFRKFTVPAVPA